MGIDRSLEPRLFWIELRFIKFRLVSRIHQSKMSPRENHCLSLSSTTSATPLGGLWVRPCVVPCLAGGPDDSRYEQRTPMHTSYSDCRGAKCTPNSPAACHAAVVHTPQCGIDDGAHSSIPAEASHTRTRAHTQTNAHCAHTFTITRTRRRIAGRIRRAGFQGTLTTSAPAGRSRRTPLRVNNGLQTDHAPRPRPTVASRLQLSARPLTEISLTARSIVTL